MSVAQTEFFNDKPKALQIGLVVEEFSLLRPCIHRHLTASRPDLHALTLGHYGLTPFPIIESRNRSRLKECFIHARKDIYFVLGVEIQFFAVANICPLMKSGW